MSTLSTPTTNEECLHTKDYLTEFNTEAYLSAYSFFEVNPSFDRLLKEVVRVFIQNKSRIGRDRALEFGGGPALFSSFIMAQYVNSITFTDYTPDNLKAVEEWINQTDDAHDWTEMFECILDYHKEEANDKSAKLNDWEKRLRDALKRGKRLQSGDVNVSPCPVLDGQDRYDIVLSSLCLEDACLTEDTYKNTIKRMNHILKPGGFIVLTHGRNQSFYTVINKRFFALPLNEQNVREALGQAGFVDIHVTGIDKSRDKFADADGFIVAYAYKPKLGSTSDGSK